MRLALAWILLFISLSSVASTIRSVDVNCLPSKKCDEFKQMFSQFENQPYRATHLKRQFAPFLSDESIESFSYLINEYDEGDVLHISISFLSIIDDIIIAGVESSLHPDLIKALPIKVGDYYYPNRAEQIKTAANHFLLQRGMTNIETFLREEFEDGEMRLRLEISSDNKVRVEGIAIEGVDGEIKEKIRIQFLPLEGKHWDRIEFKRLIDGLQRTLFDDGYFFSSVQSDSMKENNGRVRLTIKVDLGRRYHVNFSGNEIFDRQQLKDVLLQTIRKQLGRFNERELIKSLVDFYESYGIYDTNVNLVQRTGKTKFGIEFTNLYFTLKEGKKVDVAEMLFIGNDAIALDTIEELYQDNASVIASRNLLDTKYLEQFTNILKKHYLNQGFIFVSVSSPKVRVTEDGAHVEYEIREGQRCRLTRVDAIGVPEKYRQSLIDVLSNKPGQYLNVLELQNDFSLALKYIRDQGYYFATLTNVNDRDILQYSEDFSEARLVLNFSVERKAVLDSVVVTGNKKTSSRVIQREIDLTRGDILTPRDIDKLWNRLTALGLFSKIEISPFVTNRDVDDDYYNVNLLVQVTEVDFGLIEIGPGYRTDLGAKISANYAYNNVDGMNRTVNLRGQANRRIGQEGIESARPKADSSMIEFEAKASYLEPYLFKIPLEISPEISGVRKRYYNFDADIARVSLGVSKNFWDNLGLSLRYQFEDIRQYNATDESDLGRFRIGGVTTTASLDLRDGPVTPRKGSFWQLSNEYASPELFSMNSDDLMIKFNKLTARAKLYYPLHRNIVFASSVAWGYQKNLAGNSNYIPSIKVFRLNGMDNVRGYDDAEINVLPNGEDISDVVVSDEAYFSNLKLEARHYISDSTIMGLFVDGGSVNVDHFQVNTMRYSGGITIKYITPVGTIDFDYGVKYKRRDQETLGRFHLSIGFF